MFRRRGGDEDEGFEIKVYGEEEEGRRRRFRVKFPRIGKLIVILIILLVIISIIVLPLSVYQLGVGEVAVVVDPIMKIVSEPVIGPTVGFKLPWQYLIKDFYTIDYIELSEMKDADYPSITALTKDGVQITVEMTFTYSIKPELFDELARNYPRIDYEPQRLIPIITQVVRDIIAKYTVEDVITRRDEIAREIESTYKSIINEDPTLKAIQLHQVNLKGIKLPSTIESAIQEKVAAYQRKIAAQYEAERVITLAQANAKSEVIKAQAQKNATILQAEAQRQALQLIINSTGDVQLARLWMMRDLKGNIIIIVTMGNQTAQLPPIILSPVSSGKSS